MAQGLKSIETLVEDVYDLLERGLPDDYPDEKITQFGLELGRMVASRLKDRSGKPGLRMSNIGTPCNRKLYYTINCPEEAEPLTGPTRLKFLYGDLIESLLLFLVSASGHTVEGTQDTQEIEGIKGHRDAVIDGEVVDVKSASSYSFQKFEEHRLSESDPFGYQDQLQSYIHSGQDDPIVTRKDRGHFLVMDKTLGKLCLDTHPKSTFPIEKKYQYKKDMVAKSEAPARGFDPEPEGKSGNMKLPMVCSYCDFKNKCHSNLRTFIYSNGPVFLTKVAREPKVPEAK